MASLALTDAFLYGAGYDFTTDSNSAALSTEAAQLDVTNFNSGGAQELIGGLRSSTLNWSGFWQVDGTSDQAVDNQALSGINVQRVFTFGPVETENQPAYMFQANKSQYSLGGQVGEVMPFTLAASGSSGQGVIRGRLAKAAGSVSATGALGTAVGLGTVPTGQYLYATFHVFVPGTTMTVTLQSDDNADFTTPTVRATVGGGALTASGGTWVTRVAGPITDTWYRFVVTAITGTFTVAGAIGKQ